MDVDPDPDLIDPDPLSRKSNLADTAWLDHCREADAFLLDALEMLRSDLNNTAVTASRRKETERVCAGVERIRFIVTSRPVETLVKIANTGHDVWVDQCDEAKRVLESAIDLLEKPNEEDGLELDGIPVRIPQKRARVAQGLRRTRVVVSRITPTEANKNGQDNEENYAESPVKKKPKKRDENETADDEKYVLTYMDIKGLAEPVRIAMLLGNLEFTEVTMSYDELAVARRNTDAPTTLPYGQLPTLAIESDGNKTIFAQSPALLRYVGRKTGLYPLDDWKQLRVDSIDECLNDLRKTFTPLWYKNVLPRDPNTGGTNEGTRLTDEQFQSALDAVVKIHLPARLGQIENLLGSDAGSNNDDGQLSAPYVCGNVLTIADISLYVLLDGLEQNAKHKYCAPLSETGAAAEILQSHCPRLKTLYETFRNREDIKKWNQDRWGV